jgi:hypothetical protein
VSISSPAGRAAQRMSVRPRTSPAIRVNATGTEPSSGGFGWLVMDQFKHRALTTGPRFALCGRGIREISKSFPRVTTTVEPGDGGPSGAAPALGGGCLPACVVSRRSLALAPQPPVSGACSATTGWLRRAARPVSKPRHVRTASWSRLIARSSLLDQRGVAVASRRAWFRDARWRSLLNHRWARGVSRRTAPWFRLIARSSVLDHLSVPGRRTRRRWWSPSTGCTHADFEDAGD